MRQDRKFTAFCGLYCLDCIPSKRRLFRLVGELRETLEELGFDRYAELKSRRIETFSDYPRFLEVLKEIGRLECTVPCYEGPCSQTGCAPDCKVRACVLDREYEGCWECDDFRGCERLESLKDVHPGLEHNLETIKKYGVENWSDRRGKHYRW